MVDTVMSNSESIFEDRKNAATELLKATLFHFKNRTIARLIFTERLKKVISMYSNVPCGFTSGPKAGQYDPHKVSSIEKNKAYVYLQLVENYQELYYSGDDEAYERDLQQLQEYLVSMAECIDNALQFGQNS